MQMFYAFSCADNSDADFSGLCLAMKFPDNLIATRGKCSRFVRTSRECGSGEGSEPRVQNNILTTFVDASQVYGNDDETSILLRTMDGKSRGIYCIH